ncbi:MAG: acyl-CoA thioesterase [Nostocoides sp.]
MSEHHTPVPPGLDGAVGLDILLGLLDLREIGTSRVNITTTNEDLSPMAGSEATVFIGPSQRQPHHRVFGGQVLAQSLMAAGRTLDLASDDPPRPVHSLHAYFMRPGDDTEPIRFAVERMRDGRSFSTRRVHAIQKGQPILSLSASFQESADGVDHQDPMPTVPGPEGLASAIDLVAEVSPTFAESMRIRPVEIRHVEPMRVESDGAEGPSRQHVWMKAVGELPDDPLVHACVLAYASDFTLLEPIMRTHGLGYGDPRLRMASLDHAMWFHRPVRMDQWVLYEQASPSAQGARGLSLGKIFSRDGELVATVAQEGMIRIKRN